MNFPLNWLCEAAIACKNVREKNCIRAITLLLFLRLFRYIPPVSTAQAAMSDNFNETASPSPRKSLVPGVKEERSQLSDKS